MFEYSNFVLWFLASSILLFLLGIYSLRYRDRVETAGLFSLQNFAMSVWSLCYAMELATPSLEGKIFWAKMKYFGATTGPVLWLIFSLYYTNHRHWLTLPLRLALGVFIFGTIAVVFTNELHHWYWTSIYLLPGYPESQSNHGFYFRIYAVGSYLLILTSVFIYIRYYKTVPVYFRRQSIWLVIGTVLPLAVRVPEDFFNIDLIPMVDNIIFFLLISAILYAIALFRLGALEIVPIAHNLVVRNINAGILVMDVVGRVVELNPFARKLIGAKSEHAIGKFSDDVLSDWPSIGYSMQSSEQHEQEICLPGENDPQYFLAQLSPIRDEYNKLIGHVIVLVDITYRKNSEIDLERLARTDMLTSVTNRRHFFELAETQFAQAKRYNRSVAVLLLDVDHFKRVNDRYGHLAGDLILQMVARECQSQLRSSDLFARYGGEEFICLLPEQNQAGALETAEKIRRIIEQAEVVYDSQLICVTASIGLALNLHAESGLTLERLIDRADQALYESKANGRNKVSIWSVNK